MGLVIDKERLLLVEGKDEEIFFNKLFILEKISNIQVLAFDGKDNLSTDKFIDYFIGSLNSVDLKIKAVSIVLDCDKGAIQDCIKLVNAFVDKVNEHKSHNSSNEEAVVFDKIEKINQFTTAKTPLGLYVMPDCESEGALENLCLKAVMHQQFMPCVEDFIKCLKAKHNISHEHKRKTLAYFAASSEKGKPKRMHEGIEDDLFDLTSNIFDDVKYFLKQLHEVTNIVQH